LAEVNAHKRRQPETVGDIDGATWLDWPPVDELAQVAATLTGVVVSWPVTVTRMMTMLEN